jgi:CheY-like chemotaxis protein
MHALIIEDEPLLALDVVDALERLGYDTWEIAVSERQAIARAGVRSPDLVVADVRLSEGSGLDAVESIRRHSDVPVVFATANVAEVRRRFDQAIAVEKPFSHDELKGAVQRARGRGVAAAPAAAPSR